MTERTIDEDNAAFDALAALLAIVADPKAAAKRLGDLRSLSEALAQREAALAADRASFETERKRVVGEFARERESIGRAWDMVRDDRNHAAVFARADQAARAAAENAQ